MNPLKSLPIAVLGAGAAGLSASLELLSRGENVHLFEAHRLPGGCASWFRRSSKIGALQFDVGATVLDGFLAPALLAQRIKKWGVEIPNFEAMPGIYFKLAQERPAFWLSTKSPAEWIKSLQTAFPEDRHFIEQELSRLLSLAESLKELVEETPHYPLERVSDFLDNLRLIPKLPALVKNILACGDFDFEKWLDARPHSKELSHWIRMNLLITVQCAPERIYTPWAALALSFYPLGAGTLPGGMRSLMEALLRKIIANPKAQVSLNHKVSKIVRNHKGFWIDEQGPFKAVISSLSRFNTALMAPPESFPIADAGWHLDQHELWGAVTAYVATKDRLEWPEAAFNLHSKMAEGTGDDGNEAYLSFSKRDDISRAPAGYRVATLSTHTRPSEWNTLDADAYGALKEELGQRLLRHLESFAPNTEIAHVEFGTPKSFERYTHRKDGHVGGLPMTRENTLLSPRSQRTRLAGLYQIGDTSFPGQSVYACALGALTAVEKICRKT